MSETLGMKNTTVRMTGKLVNVPSNVIAKLMYYLGCVATVIDYKDNTLTNFKILLNYQAKNY